MKNNRLFRQLIQNRVLAGLLLIVPMILSLWLAWFLYYTLTEWAVAVTLDHLPEKNRFFWIQGVRISALVLMLGLFFFIGQIARFRIFNFLFRIPEWLFLKIPILSAIYTTCRQIGRTLWSSEQSMFRQVVMLEYPRKGCWTIGFVTDGGDQDNELCRKTGRNLISVFLPTTPNPTSGTLLFVPREECIFLDMNVAEGMRLVISGGTAKKSDSQ